MQSFIYSIALEKSVAVRIEELSETSWGLVLESRHEIKPMTIVMSLHVFLLSISMSFLSQASIT